MPSTKSLRTRLFAALAAAGTALLLAGCGLVAEVVPPIDVGDPLGVDGLEVQSTLQPGEYSIVYNYIHTNRTFDVDDLQEDTLYGFSIERFNANVGLEPTVRLSGTPESGEFPHFFFIYGAGIQATMHDVPTDGSDPRRVRFHRDIDHELWFERTGCDADGCTYEYNAEESNSFGGLESVLDLDVTAEDDLGTLFEILKAGETETPNEANVSVWMNFVSDDDLSGLTATFTLTSEGSTIEIGG